MPISPLTLLHTSAAGLLARQLEIDTAADNLANLNTPGFRPSRVDFQEFLSPEVEPALTNGPYRGTALGVTRRSTAMGSLRPSSSPLHLAIDGEGFFQVTLPDGGLAYTRDGQFSQDANGDLVTSAGYRLAWAGRLPAAADQLHVNPDGSVMARTGETWEEVGQIQIARFDNASGLISLGDNLLAPGAATGAAQAGQPGANGLGQLLSGVLEASGVDLVDEMSYLLVAQRAYAMALQAFGQADNMIAQAIRLREG